MGILNDRKCHSIGAKFIYMWVSGGLLATFGQKKEMDSLRQIKARKCPFRLHKSLNQSPAKRAIERSTMAADLKDLHSALAQTLAPDPVSLLCACKRNYI
jgi:CDP-diacylglycerol pyrophosphatase